MSVASITVVDAIAWELFTSKRAVGGALATFPVAPYHVYYSTREINETIALFFFALAPYAIVSAGFRSR